MQMKNISVSELEKKVGALTVLCKTLKSSKLNLEQQLEKTEREI